MRKLQLLLTAILLCVFAMSACTESGTQDEINNEMAITFEGVTNNTLEVGYEECVCTLPYTITNGITGIDIVAETRAEWISDVKVANGELSFKVLRNNTPSERNGRIAVKYPTMSDISITVSQLQFDAITFEEAIAAPKEIYYPKKLARDTAARNEFQKEKGRGSVLTETYILDIIRQGWKNDDERLQRVVLG